MKAALVAAAVAASFFATPAGAQPAPRAVELVEQGDAILWGKTTMQAEYEMMVVTPRWTRTMALKAWVDRPRKNFTRITAPAKEAGSGSLALGTEMWNYVPSLERTIKIPPSLMLQSWFGSDFTNDDLLNQGGMVKNYEHKLLGEKTVDGMAAWEVELLPRREAPVAWGRIVSLFRKPDGVPLAETYYDERGAMAREVRYGDIKVVSGRERPTRMEVVPANPPGKKSVLILKSAVMDQPIDPEVFTLQNLTRK
jgi:outer membrane lipoprotein-sorting protein